MVGAPWSLGEGPSTACLPSLLLSWCNTRDKIPVRKLRRHKLRSAKRIQHALEKPSCGFESLKTPPADDQLWQAQNAQDSSSVPPNIGPPPGAAGARFPGGRVPKKLKHVETFLKQRSSSFEWTWSGGLIPPGCAATRQNKLVGGTLAQKLVARWGYPRTSKSWVTGSQKS